MSKDLKELEGKIGYKFDDFTLFTKAMIHSSYANEKHLPKYECNERLEFLGDAVLELVSSEFLFHNNPKLPEGELTKTRASMVCEPALAFCARDLDLGEYLLPKGTEGHTGFRFHGLHLRDVRSGGESLLSGPPDDEDADLGIAVDRGKGVVKFLQYGAVQRVQPIGTVQREVSHAVLFLKKDVLVHNPLPSLQAVACQGPKSHGRRFQIRTGRRDRCRTGGVQGPSSLPCWPDGRS